MTLKIHPIQPGDRIMPGRIVFACWRERENRRKYDVRNYWLFVVVTEDMVPDRLRRSRPIVTSGESVHPVWMMRRGMFMWANRTAMYYLDDTQLYAFTETDLRVEFETQYQLAQQKPGLKPFADEILADKFRLDGRSLKRGTSRDEDGGLFCSDGEGNSENDDDGNLEYSGTDMRMRKRARKAPSPPVRRSAGLLTTSSASPTQSSPSLGADRRHSPITSNTTPATSSAADKVKIKSEGGESSLVDMVTVHIGMHNKTFHIPEAAIQQSAVLSGLVVRKPGKLPYVMDPDLKDIPPRDFEAVAQFMQDGEFTPLFTCAAVTAETPAPGTGSLAGVVNASQDGEQILRLGRLYQLARRLQLPAMQALVRKKIVAGFPRGWDAKTMLAMVSQVFRDLPGHVDNAACLLGDDGAEAEGGDPLKEWLVQWLADNLELITQTRSAVEYWTTLDRAVGLKLAVSRTWAEIIELYKGSVVRIMG